MVMYEEVGLWEVMKALSSLKGLVFSLKRPQRGSHPLRHVRTQREGTFYKPESRFSSDTEFADILILDFQPLEQW